MARCQLKCFEAVRRVSTRFFFLCVQQTPAAQLSHRKMHTQHSSVRGVGKSTTAGSYCSYCCSIGCGGRAAAAAAAAAAFGSTTSIFFLSFFLYGTCTRRIVCRQRCFAQQDTQQSARCRLTITASGTTYGLRLYCCCSPGWL